MKWLMLPMNGPKASKYNRRLRNTIEAAEAPTGAPWERSKTEWTGWYGSHVGVKRTLIRLLERILTTTSGSGKGSDDYEQQEDIRSVRSDWDGTQGNPSQSKNAGKNAVEEALRLRKSCDASPARVAQLDAILTDTNAPLYEVAEAELELERLRPKFKKALAEVSQQERLLGVEGMAQYRHLVSSPFLQARMNALAVKTRLQRKIVTHTEDSIKRRDPGIQRLARSYNELHKKMVDLVRTKRAPRNAVIPSEIDMKHLFKLDVDNNIWQDIGLDEMTDLEELPLWLCDEGVRKGIQAKLELDRCNEELRRLTHERKTLREWMAEEWDVLCTTIEHLDGEADLLYQLTESKQNLLRLCVRWDSALESLPVIRGLNTWGPTTEELEEEAKKMHVEVLVNTVISDEDKETGDEAEMQEYETDESDVDDGFDEDDLDVGLVERLDALRLADSRTSDCDSDGEMVL
ncbi:hypothetical protein DFJ43DRAFT_1196795 [Lentinula guzmanii]|uniref:Uncharacterized protein n=1 Tax=Lentinula guzmanii TaxID=2804957 RepID=A0AA38MX81_9AGAR|nr:hypothetical protein DFJ43DRAFT_1196795 [Lentinula guzmanii]